MSAFPIASPQEAKTCNICLTSQEAQQDAVSTQALLGDHFWAKALRVAETPDYHAHPGPASQQLMYNKFRKECSRHQEGPDASLFQPFKEFCMYMIVYVEKKVLEDHNK
ncbi:NAD kinase [Pteropus alecto]|uniref:NAD kinase n=1 Tax=Pteropus alecto TaxID=9402 RepID=L5K8E1_PTEAL|nr:NAD kinase [Pteropus alecto]